MFRVALTGGIASGKSAVADEFARLGVPVIDADVAARAVVVNGSEGLQQLVTEFGEGILDERGELNRRALRAIIFNDDAARQRVNRILHPRIREYMRADAAKHSASYALFVIPLLLETSQAQDYDRVLVVTADRATRIQRLCSRDHIDETQAQQILATQASDQERLQIAHDIITNDGDRQALKPAVYQLHQLYSTLAAKE